MVGFCSTEQDGGILLYRTEQLVLVLSNPIKIKCLGYYAHEYPSAADLVHYIPVLFQEKWGRTLCLWRCPIFHWQPTLTPLWLKPKYVQELYIPHISITRLNGTKKNPIPLHSGGKQCNHIHLPAEQGIREQHDWMKVTYQSLFSIMNILKYISLKLLDVWYFISWWGMTTSFFLSYISLTLKS